MPHKELADRSICDQEATEVRTLSPTAKSGHEATIWRRSKSEPQRRVRRVSPSTRRRVPETPNSPKITNSPKLASSLKLSNAPVLANSTPPKFLAVGGRPILASYHESRRRPNPPAGTRKLAGEKIRHRWRVFRETTLFHVRRKANGL